MKGDSFSIQKAVPPALDVRDGSPTSKMEEKNVRKERFKV